VYAEFDTHQFVRQATQGLEALEFHARVKHFSDALEACLPPVPEALKIIVKSLPEPLPDCESVTEGWLMWPLGKFIDEYGLGHYEESMKAMKELTMRLTAEFPVRAFIEQDPERCMGDLLALSTHPNPHVRRWCSEGCRPRLPWGRQLHYLVSDPSLIWPILENLKDDPELYVRRSVANNLNDISKDHPKEVVKRCGKWLEQATVERQWIVKHGLRTLLKQGDASALRLLGFRAPRQIQATLKLEPSQVQLGESVDMQVELKNTGKKSQLLMLDYVIHYLRQNGQPSAKVFKWKIVTLEKDEHVTISKKHPMKKTSVRVLYPGVHQVEIQVNGALLASGSFRFDG